jgi:cation transport ATPase
MSILLDLAVGMSLFEIINRAVHAYLSSTDVLLLFLPRGCALDRAMRARKRTLGRDLAASRSDAARQLGREGELAEVPAAALQSADQTVVQSDHRL